MNCEHKGEVLKYADGSRRCLDCEKMIKPDYKTQIKAQAATIAQLQAIATAAREYFHKTKGLADFAHIEYEDLEAALASLEQETK